MSEHNILCGHYCETHKRIECPVQNCNWHDKESEEREYQNLIDHIFKKARMHKPHMDYLKETLWHYLDDC